MLCTSYLPHNMVQHVGIYYMNVYSMHCTNLIRFLFIVDMSLCNVEMAQFNRANLKVCSFQQEVLLVYSTHRLTPGPLSIHNNKHTYERMLS